MLTETERHYIQNAIFLNRDKIKINKDNPNWIDIDFPEMANQPKVDLAAQIQAEIDLLRIIKKNIGR